MRHPFENPILLRPDRFTPLTRTPWAGTTLAETVKSQVVEDFPQSDQRIGESWEFSADPELPSLTLAHDETLMELLHRDPAACLSPKLLQELGGKAHFEILVKLIHAASPLSLQVHPADDDPYLTANECGKPESWLVLDAEPGCGLYLGFSRPISLDELRSRLLQGEDAKDLLQFVPVQRGDYFDLAPGVPHAIGPGVVLLEPQRIRAGKSGKTYRMWDWGRTYNVNGDLDPAGQPRQLHLEEALRLISPETQVGEEFVASLRRRPNIEPLPSGAALHRYPANQYYQVDWLQCPDTARFRILGSHGYGIVTCLRGGVDLRGEGGQELRVKQGYTALLPFAAWPIEINGSAASECVLLSPPSLKPEWQAY